MKVPLRFSLHHAARFLLPVACAALAGTLTIPRATAQTTGAAVANATVQPAGPRTTTAGTNFFNVEGSSNGTNGSLASFGVLDFSASSFNPNGQTADGVSGGSITLSLTEYDAAFTLPSSLEFYLTTVTGTSISNATGASPLKYNGTSAGDGSAPTSGIDTGLGTVNGNASGTLFDLGSGSFTTMGNTHTGQVDTFTLTLGSAVNAFLTELNTSGGNLRLVIANTTAKGAATFFGATNTTATNRPTLSFTPTFSVGNSLNWAGASGGSWAPTGTTNWGTTAGGTGTSSWNNDGTYTGVFGASGGKTVNIDSGNINAAGLEFDAGSYVLNGTGTSNTLTFSSTGHNINVVNSGDTATINAPIAGTVGLSKIGAGTLVLGGANTFAGTVGVAAGTLQISSDGNLGAASNGVSLSGGTLSTTGSVTFASGRTLTGGGGLAVATGNTATFNGVVNTTSLTLSGGGTVLLANSDGVANGQAFSNSVGTLTFNNASTLTTTDPNTGNGLGFVQVGGTTVPTSVTGAATLNSNLYFASGTTNTFNVANAGSTLTVQGDIAGSGVILAKTGSGTLVLNGSNPNFTAPAATTTTPNPASVRQGTAGATPVDGGIIAVVSGTALGNGQYQLNAGTLRNDSGGTLTFANTLSLGAQNATTTPGGGVFADKGGSGTAGIIFTGAISLFQGGTTVYARTLTLNTPTTLTGGLTQTGTSGTGGLTFAGTSTLLLNAVTPNTLTVPITIANTGCATAATDGSFGATTTLTIATGVNLTLNTGGTGTIDTINNAALVTLNGASGAFGKIVLTLAGTTETVGGLVLGLADNFRTASGATVMLAAGSAPAGTYGAIGSGADYQSNDYFGGFGLLLNTAAVPEPSTWITLAIGCGAMFAFARFRRVAKAN